jgi:hypothetical protein
MPTKRNTKTKVERHATDKPQRLNNAYRAWHDRSFTSFFDAAQVIGVCKTSVFHWYHGNSIPKWPTVFKIEKISGRKVPVDSWVNTVRA